MCVCVCVVSVCVCMIVYAVSSNNVLSGSYGITVKMNASVHAYVIVVT